MAYPTRGRDPFLDAATQAFLERRGVEALGLIVLAVGVAFALALASYAPEDSAWISARWPGYSKLGLGRLAPWSRRP